MTGNAAARRLYERAGFAPRLLGDGEGAAVNDGDSAGWRVALAGAARYHCAQDLGGTTMRRSSVAMFSLAATVLAVPTYAEQTGTQPAPARGVAEARCPATIAVEERMPEPPAGWTATKGKGGHSLAGVTFYDGPPADGASLVYDETATSGDDWIATWRFTPGPRAFWIECRYEGTAMQLARALPPTVTLCRVAYDKRIVKDPRHDEVRRLECQ